MNICLSYGHHCFPDLWLLLSLPIPTDRNPVSSNRKRWDETIYLSSQQHTLMNFSYSSICSDSCMYFSFSFLHIFSFLNFSVPASGHVHASFTFFSRPCMFCTLFKMPQTPPFKLNKKEGLFKRYRRQSLLIYYKVRFGKVQ